MNIIPLPAFRDNYIWLIHDGQRAAVVDPGDAEPVLAYLAQHGLELAAILITHHHADHVGGLKRLLEHRRIPVFGPRKENIEYVTHPLVEGDSIAIPGLALELQVLEVPAHTAGHIAYFAPGILFCGDTLFSAGCGRLFEGTAEQLQAALSRFAALDG
ncbi:MAG: hydroxyacylglutathione hydrolase, partial [Betaproteobacteria bacterium HGW-Betaproteobacteria-21]